MIKYDLLEHTADIGIRVKANDLKELFRQAALAVADLMAKPKTPGKVGKTQDIKIALTAADTQALFVHWLNEVISLSDCQHIVFVDVKLETLTQTQLKATAKAASREYFTGQHELKAATYCDLKIEKRKGGYIAEVILDV